MKEHTWIIEYVDAGMLDGDFWHCKVCGAGGGAALDKSHLPTHIFLPNGSGLKLSDDCDISKQLIAAFKLGRDCQRRWKT